MKDPSAVFRTMNSIKSMKSNSNQPSFEPQRPGASPWRAAVAVAGLCLGLGSPAASAVLVVSFDALQLQPDQPGQMVSLWIDNTGGPVSIGGMDLAIQVGDGGPAGGGSVLGPILESVNLVVGTIFDGHDFGGQFGDAANVDQRQFWSVVAPTAEVPGDGRSLLATVTFDTTGFGAGSWDVALSGLAFAESRLFDPFGEPLAVQFGNSALTIVPEVSPGWMAGMLLVMAVGGTRFVARSKGREAAR